MTVQTISAAREPNDILECLNTDGCLILDDLIDVEVIDRIVSELRPYFAKAEFGQGPFCGYRTKRLGGIGRKSGSAIRLLSHPLIVWLIESILGPHCDRIQLNLSQAINMYPDEKAQVVHRGDAMFPCEGFRGELMANVIWALDDIGPESGSAHVVMGSHRWARDRVPREDEIEQVSLRKGSALIYLGSLLQGGGANVSDKERSAIVFGYNLGWLRQAEVQFLVFPPEIARFLPKSTQHLIGYAVHRPNCGLLECEDPILALSPNMRRKLSSRDYLVEQQSKALEEGVRIAV